MVMICHVKQSFEVKNGAGERFTARNNDIVVPPEWVIHHPYFQSLCDAGKVTVHMDSKAMEKAQVQEEAPKSEAKEEPKEPTKKGKK
jgi:hypothetical protein